MQVVHCPCGDDVEGESDDRLVENVQASRIASDHPDMVDKYSSQQILEMAQVHDSSADEPARRRSYPVRRLPAGYPLLPV